MIGESYDYMNDGSPTKGTSQTFICQTPTNNDINSLDLMVSSVQKNSNSGKKKTFDEKPAAPVTANNALSKKFNFEFGDISEEEDKDEDYKDVKVQEDEDDDHSVDINMDDINIWTLILLSFQINLALNFLLLNSLLAKP